MICLDFGWTTTISEKIFTVKSKSVCKLDVKMNNSNVLIFRFGKMFMIHSLIDVFVAYQLFQPVCFGFDHSLKITFCLFVPT